MARIYHSAEKILYCAVYPFTRSALTKAKRKIGVSSDTMCSTTLRVDAAADKHIIYIISDPQGGVAGE